MTTNKHVRSAFESMLFTWGEPLSAKAAGDVMNMSEKDAVEVFEELAAEYEQEHRGIRIRRINKSYQFVTSPDNEECIEKLCTPVKRKKLSQSALEVLAIVAYKQPVTKGEIEAVRGIRCDRVMEGLVKKELVEEKGRSNGIGRPILYGTTDAFLRYFDLADLSELPEIDDIEGAIETPDDFEDSVMLNQMSLDDIGKEDLAADEAETAAGQQQGEDPEEETR